MDERSTKQCEPSEYDAAERTNALKLHGHPYVPQLLLQRSISLKCHSSKLTRFLSRQTRQFSHTPAFTRHAVELLDHDPDAYYMIGVEHRIPEPTPGRRPSAPTSCWTRASGPKPSKARCQRWEYRWVAAILRSGSAKQKDKLLQVVLMTIATCDERLGTTAIADIDDAMNLIKLRRPPRLTKPAKRGTRFCVPLVLGQARQSASRSPNWK